MPITATVGNPTVIRPEDVYPLQGLIAASGLSYTRIRDAARDGIEIPTFAVGRRKFIKGSAAIEYLERLAAHYAASKEAEQ